MWEEDDKFLYKVPNCCEGKLVRESEGCRTVNTRSGSSRRFSAILKKGPVLGEIEVNKWFHVYAWNNWGESGEF